MRRLPVYFLLDTSGSMRGAALTALNDGIALLISTLRRNPAALETVWLSILAFDDSARQVLPLTELLDARVPALTVDKGLTRLGEGLSLLADRLASEVERGSATRKGDWKPLAFLLTDGEPTDDWRAGLKRLRACGSITLVACAIGPDTDTTILKEITPHVVEMARSDGADLGEFFKWVSASVSLTSQQIDPTPGDTDLLEGLPALPEVVKRVDKPRKPAPAPGKPDSPFNQDRARRAANKDRFGNPDGPEFDLARDGAFRGLNVAVLHLYTGEGFDFKLPERALAEKGFGVQRWENQPPRAAELESALKSACQLWIISDQVEKLGEDHLGVIGRFFLAGRGLYIWGDNAPYFADANRVARRLLSAAMSGDTPGGNVVGLAPRAGAPGMLPGHPICTGLEHLYEGVTIATIEANPGFTPLVHGSAGNLVVAVHDQDGRRAIIDGGFTRLYHKWDTAGTGRYVKNAAAWLANYERFGPSLFTP